MIPKHALHTRLWGQSHNVQTGRRSVQLAVGAQTSKKKKADHKTHLLPKHEALHQSTKQNGIPTRWVVRQFVLLLQWWYVESRGTSKLLSYDGYGFFEVVGWFCLGNRGSVYFAGFD